MDIGGSSFKTLGVKVVQVGVPEAVAQLDQYGAAGEKAAQRVEQSIGRTSGTFSQNFVRDAKAATAAVQSFGNGATVTFGQTATSTSAAGAAMFDFSEHTRKAATETEKHSLATGRLVRGLESIIVESTGANHALLTIVGTLGEFAAGHIVILAIAAAVGVVTFAYDKLTEGERKAKEEQEKTTEALRQWYAAQQQGAPGDLVPQINAITTHLRELREELNHGRTGGFSAAPVLQQIRASLLAGASSIANPAFSYQDYLNAQQHYIQQYYDGLADEHTKDSAIAAAAIKAANEKITQAIRDAAEKQNQELTSLLGSGRATGGDTGLAGQLASDLQRQLGFLSTNAPAASSGDAYRKNLEERARLTAQLTALETALLEPERQRLELERATTQAETQRIEAATRDAIAVRQITEGTRLANVALTDQLALLHREGTQRELLANQLDFQHQKEKSVVDILADEKDANVQANVARALNIDTLEKENAKLIVKRALIEAVKKAQEDFNTAVKNLKPAPLPDDPQGAAIKKAFDDAKAAREAFNQEVVRGIADDLSGAIASGFHDGIKSAEEFANSALALFEKIAARAATLKLGEALFGGSGLGRTAEEETAYHTKPVGGGPTAFDRDQLSTFAVTAGAVIGVANALNTLTGASRNSAAAIQSMADSFAHFVTSTRPAIDALQAQLNGRPLDSQLQQIDALRKQTEQDLAGKRLEGYREQQLAELNALEAQRIKQLQEEAAALRATTSQGYTVRLQRAQGNVQGASDAEFAYGQSKELIDFLHEFGLNQPELFAQLTATLDAEKAAYEQAKKDAEAAKALQNTRSIEDANLATQRALANGPNGTQAVRDVIDMQALVLQHQREIADLQQQGASAELIAATKAKDAAEEAALAWQQTVAAIQQAQSDIQRDVALGFKTPDQARGEEAQAFGFGGLTNDQIRALYTPFAGQPLTNLQEQTNKNIETFFKDFPDVMAQAIAGLPSAGARASAAGQREAITRGAELLTEATGNRLADYESAQLIEMRKQTGLLTDIAGGRRFSGSVSGLTPLSPASFGPILPNLIAPPVDFARSPTPIDPEAFASAVVAALPRVAVSLPGATGSPGGIVVNVNLGGIRVTQQPGESSDDLLQRMFEQFQAKMAAAAKAAFLKAGDPIKPGL